MTIIYQQGVNRVVKSRLVIASPGDLYSWPQMLSLVHIICSGSKATSSTYYLTHQTMDEQW